MCDMMARKQRAPKRDATVIFASKLESVVGTATVLIAKLQAMQRHKAVRTDETSRARYVKLLEVLIAEAQGLAPVVEGSTEESPFASI